MHAVSNIGWGFMGSLYLHCCNLIFVPKYFADPELNWKVGHQVGLVPNGLIPGRLVSRYQGESVRRPNG